MKRSLFLFVITAIVITLAAMITNGSTNKNPECCISGTAYNGSEPAPNCEVWILYSSERVATCMTNSSGFFECCGVPGIEEGTYRIEVYCPNDCFGFKNSTLCPGPYTIDVNCQAP